ncbi:hypothetical protein BC939DRAFT_503654 [Gamsiella multidivaricata]|uniref:uncharacterized protein n=1 Tax=Gamsiella multidivaricata TaxID=101098 RepID=UPI002220ABB5|nr:uncharacterized protein BC939DRAFT_503654 [Gamsiella multidivaricata]KAI7822644.1 hypothetical protein BC939DRAFT_503654 [Gamsiella multidivaricata]
MAQPVRSVDRRFSTTAFTYPGYHIAASHGVAGKAVLGAFASLAGGESSTYIEMAEKARERAFLRMLEHAAAAGGNAVIGVQFTGQEIIQDLSAKNASPVVLPPTNFLFFFILFNRRMTEVMAYGTAVTLVPLQQQQQQQQQQQAMTPQATYAAAAPAPFSPVQPGTPYSQPGTPYSQQPTSPYSQPMAHQQYFAAPPAAQPSPQQQQQYATPAPPPKN